MRKRVKVTYDATRGFHVDLPSYAMVPGTFEPVTPDLVAADGVLATAKVADALALGLTVEVDVPDEDCDCEKGAIDPKKIRARYRAWRQRAAPDV